MDFLVSLLRSFWKFLGSLLRIFWEFFGGFFGRNFLEELFWRTFMEKIFGRNFFARVDFGRKFFRRNTLFTLLKSVKVFEYEWNLCFCQDFGVMPGRKEGRRISILRSAIASSSHLKKLTFIRKFQNGFIFTKCQAHIQTQFWQSIEGCENILYLIFVHFRSQNFG